MTKSESIVLELQKLATDKSNDITDLLRKALLVATKLKINTFREWIKNELDGYQNNNVPKYRELFAEIMMRHPHRGLVPAIIPNNKIGSALCNVSIKDPLGSLTELLEHDADSGVLIVPFSHAQTALLMNLQAEFPMQPVRVLGRNHIASIIDAIRTAILEWAIRLEDEGILGRGLTFSSEEQQIAQRSQVIQIENFQGIFGDVYNSTVSQNLKTSIKVNDMDALQLYLQSLGLTDNDRKDLETAIKADSKPISPGSFGENVSNWIGKMLSKSASGVWQVGLKVATDLLVDAIKSYYGF